MPNPLRFTVKARPRNRQVELLVSELDERLAAVIEWFPYLVARRTLDDIVRFAPRDMPGYPKMLKVRRVELPGVDSAVGVLAPGYAHSQRLSAQDATVTLLFLKPVRTFNAETDKYERSKVATVLAKRNPWTMGTLPFEPPRKIASIRALRATEKEVKRIEEMRLADLPEVLAELGKLGIKPRAKGEKFSRRVTRDLAFEVLRREFGISAPHKAHWRPALRRATTAHVDASLRMLVRWVTVPSERRWLKRVVVKGERPAVAKRVKRFQDTLAKHLG